MASEPITPALFPCPCGCRLLTTEPAKLCSWCGERSSAAHWDGLVDACEKCAGEAYGE